MEVGTGERRPEGLMSSIYHLLQEEKAAKKKKKLKQSNLKQNSLLETFRLDD